MPEMLSRRNTFPTPNINHCHIKPPSYTQRWRAAPLPSRPKTPNGVLRTSQQIAHAAVVISLHRRTALLTVNVDTLETNRRKSGNEWCKKLSYRWQEYTGKWYLTGIICIMPMQTGISYTRPVCRTVIARYYHPLCGTLNCRCCLSSRFTLVIALICNLTELPMARAVAIRIGHHTDFLFGRQYHLSPWSSVPLATAVPAPPVGTSGDWGEKSAHENGW